MLNKDYNNGYHKNSFKLETVRKTRGNVVRVFWKRTFFFSGELSSGTKGGKGKD